MNFADSNEIASPIVKRTSGYFDKIYDYDSISACSGSTVADSAYVAQQVRIHEEQRRMNEINKLNKQATVYNLRFDKFVIAGATAKSDEGIEKPMKAAVNQIISDFNKSSENFVATKKETKWEKIKKPKRLVPIALLIVTVIALSITIPVIIGNRDKGEVADDSTTTTTETEPTTLSQEMDPSTASTTTSTESSTTELPPNKVKLVKRDAWTMSGLELSGKFKLLSIERIIILRTETDSCESESTCVDFLFEHQQNAYPEFDDIQENFLIAIDGTVFEGRGIWKEGQTTYDSRTSYNDKALSIAFLSTESESSPSEQQQTAFCKFIGSLLATGELNKNFMIFQHSDLKSSFSETHEDISLEGCELSLTKPPVIVKRRDWNATEFPKDFDFVRRRRSTKVIVGSTEDQDCNSKESCELLVRGLQQSGLAEHGETFPNFIISGDLIFEGRGFDVAASDFFDSLWILHLGNIVTTSEGESFMQKLEKFLKYSLDIGKLSSRYTIHGERQVNGSVSSPGDVLFELIRNHPNFNETFTKEQ